MIETSAVKTNGHLALVVFSGLDKELAELLGELQVASHLYTSLKRAINLDTILASKKQLQEWAETE